MILTSFVIVWLAAACAVLGLAAYRKLVSHFEEDDKIHLRDVDTALVSHQAEIAERLDVVDKWGKTLTVAVVVTGILIAGVYLYKQWIESSQVLH